MNNKLRFSIVWKLNFNLFLRTLRIFLTLDIFLLLLTSAGLIIQAEQTAASVFGILEREGLPDQTTASWLMLKGDTITPQAGEGKGFHIPEQLQYLFPPTTVLGVRSVDWPSASGSRFPEQLHSLSYNVTLKVDSGFYRVSIRFPEALDIVFTMSAIVLFLELLMLLRSIFSGAKMIRKTLQPIQELTEAAQNLSGEGLFSPEQLRDLAGKLDDINAAKLDTRISVGETQNELKSLALAINGMLDRINASYRSQVRFVSDASHELRTPISVLQGYANLLDRWGKNDETTRQECIDAIKDETANMKELVEQLLFLARGDNNTMPLQVESFELDDLAGEVLRETQMIDNGHEYASSLSSVSIKADKSLIKQATRILVDNAIKYSPTGKPITISVAQANHKAYLTVQDEGIGIPPEALAKIFDRFYRTDKSRARATGGAGLGLAIAKWIAERHGGYIEVLSRVEIGTRISLILPIGSDSR